MPAFIPEGGDLIWLTFDPLARREEAGRRPALILSPKAYNQNSGLALVCPVSDEIAGYPFEVPIPDGCGLEGVILADQVRSLDWQGRNAIWVGRVPVQTLNEVLARLAPLLGR